MLLTDAVQRFRTLRALVIGDAMLDSYLEGSAARLCREGPVPVVRKTSEAFCPGGAANTAANLRALGAETLFLSVVGADAAGSALRRALRERGVGDRWLLEDESGSTLHKMRILADDQYVVRFDSGDRSAEGQSQSLPYPIRRQLQTGLAELYPHCDLLVVSDYQYGAVTDEMIALIGELRAEDPRPLVVDAKDVRRFQGAGATFITPNHLEAQLAVEPANPYTGEPDVARVTGIGRALLARIDAEYAAITMAKDGVLVVGRDGPAAHLRSWPVPRANDVGAGDSFTAGLALGLGGGASPVDAARIGVEAAGLAVTKRRTAVVQHQELLQRISLVESPMADADLSWQRRLDALIRQLEEERRSSRTVVFTNGVFDILHAGHVHFLRQAKSLGDVLVVAVNSDRSARLLKGRNRPVQSERDRLSLVAALDPVDHVILFDEETPADLIRVLRPDIHAKGGDYAGEDLPEAEAVTASGGRVVILPLLSGPAPEQAYSTSHVIERIVGAVSYES